MQIVILLIVAFVAITIMGLVKVRWNDDARAKIESMTKERAFWRLVKGYDGFFPSIEAILTLYLDPRHISTFMLVGPQPRSKEDTELLNLLNEKEDITNVNMLNRASEKRDTLIKTTISGQNKSFSKAEIQKAFDNYKDELLIVSEQYDKYVQVFLRLLPSDHVKAVEIWETRKELEEVASEHEWKTEEEKIDLESLFSLKKSVIQVGEVVERLLCEESSEETREVLKKSINQWGRLQMLKWCIVDSCFVWIGTNRIQRFGWRILGSFAS